MSDLKYHYALWRSRYNRLRYNFMCWLIGAKTPWQRLKLYRRMFGEEE